MAVLTYDCELVPKNLYGVVNVESRTAPVRRSLKMEGCKGFWISKVASIISDSTISPKLLHFLGQNVATVQWELFQGNFRVGTRRLWRFP